ncbi:MAG: hypothetical protein AAFN93_19150 [Bacteroidota bacterium]
MHPKSLTSQKLFLINNIRRKYPLKEDENKKGVKKVAARPLVRSKPAVSVPKKESEVASENLQVSKPKIKPKVVRPVLKPKTADEDAENGSSSEEEKKVRPKVLKPVVKSKTSNESLEKDIEPSSEKPKALKPKIKPRVVVKSKIKPPKKED